ncbi:MAG TPA: DUF4160 domain-containing protein [Chloroflexia bacterium]|jgi:hypothetical protein
MPTSKVRVKGYRFIFYSSDEGEPQHIHVKEGQKHAKFWLAPEVKLAKNYQGSFREHELNELYDIIEEHVETFRGEWDDDFGSTA